MPAVQPRRVLSGVASAKWPADAAAGARVGVVARGDSGGQPQRVRGCRGSGRDDPRVERSGRFGREACHAWSLTLCITADPFGFALR